MPIQNQHYVRFTNIRIPKEHREQCLSTSGGGPQVFQIQLMKIRYIISQIEIGQPHDQELSDVTVVNLTAENTGDDSLALFNVVQDAKISDCYIR